MAGKKKITQPGLVDVTCPGCQSKITSDGSTLRSRSKYLEELIEKASGLDEIDKAADALEKQNDALKALVQSLQNDLKAKDEKLKETEKSVEQAKKRGEWY